jgi:hypothetical protein
LLGNIAFTEEGMWLYNAVPNAKIKSIYGFGPTQQWLDHARLSSVRFMGVSGSFVSPDGLLMTNHHVAARCIDAISTTAGDYMETGLYAHTNAGEVSCPNMSVQVPEGIENITAKVNAGLKDGAASHATQQRSVSNTLQIKCWAATNLTCQA